MIRIFRPIIIIAQYVEARGVRLLSSFNALLHLPRVYSRATFTHAQHTYIFDVVFIMSTERTNEIDWFKWLHEKH